MRMFFKCHRTPEGDLTDWYVIEKLPETWPEGSTANFYKDSENIMYLIPDDSVRYYTLDNGAL